MSTERCGCLASVPTGPTLASTCGGSAFMLFMSLLEGFIRSQCDLENACGRATPRFRSEPDYDYDFIVIGAGSAGSVVASRLSEVPEWKVLLIEAGDDEPVGTQVPGMSLNFLGSDIDWRFTTEPERMACLNSQGQRCSWPRGKVLGGTSVLNGMTYNRGNREDYDNWAAMDNPGWSYEEVLPFFLKSEDNLQLDKMDSEFHATGGPLPVSLFPFTPPISYAILKGGEELGFAVQDLNGRNSTGFMITQMTSRNGVRYSTARSFLGIARNRNNLHILLNTTASKVLFKPDSKTVVGVEMIDQYGGTRQIFAKKEVIVSGGAVNSPQILLLSGIGPADELSKVNVRPIHSLPGVGKNLHNHVSFPTNFFVNENATAPLNWATAMEYLLFRDGPMSGTGLADVTAKVSTRYAEVPDVPDLQLLFAGYSANCSRTGIKGELLSTNNRSINITPAVIDPKSRGTITLASADPLAPPRIIANYLTHERDVKTLVEGIKFAVKLSQTTPLKEYGMRLDRTPAAGCESLTFGSDAYWECAVRRDTGPENHQAGSCKMGPASDPLAVVDHELRVHGVSGLRVADASIMPQVASGNIHAPTVMIGEKAAYMIKSVWGGQV